MFKLQRKELTAEQKSKVAEVGRKQELSTGFRSTTDDTEMFSIPINEKIIVYVPNHQREDKNGNLILRADRPLFHRMKVGSRYMVVRCTAGLNELGYESCPLCESVQVHWDLANLQIEDECRHKGLDPSDKKNEAVSEVKRKYYSNRALDSSNSRLTFPICVINTKEKDEEGMPKYDIFWYQISENYFNRKWGSAMRVIESGDQVDLSDMGQGGNEADGFIVNPAGRFFTLDYTYDTKGREPTAMFSAQNLEVIPLNLRVPKGFAERMDEATLGYDEAQAAESVVDNLFYEEESLAELANQVSDPVRQKIELLQIRHSAEIAGAGFNVAEIGAKIQNEPSNTKSIETDHTESLEDVSEEEDFDSIFEDIM